MLQESMPSLLASFYGWLTPTVLFLLLNLVIGTIAVVSVSSSSHHRHQPGAAADEDAAAYPGRFLTRSLSRTPSAVFDRLRSFNHHRFSSSEIAPPLVPAPALASAEILDPAPPAAATEDERHHHLDRSQSDAQPTAGEMPPKLPDRMKKSASEKSAFGHFKGEEVEEAEAAAREAVDLVEGEDGEEVDARADDFINRFRHQLKLQRLESIMRYKENLSRGS